MNDDTDFLEHFGVKGMKWGQRKTRGPQGRADKLARAAERRPTRGNLRTAQRAQQVADRKAYKTENGQRMSKRSQSKSADREVKAKAKLKLGEIAVVGLVGTPLMLIPYKRMKSNSARSMQAARDIGGDAKAQEKAAARFSKPRVIGLAVLGTPVSALYYAGGKHYLSKSMTPFEPKAKE